ncbi:hypothetical protein [Kitasatospora sp. GP82]|uniref:hypothetical protein n=1 Tax=Kitasatospora sp. GP82 TaxID=3035089 RepID=UPI002474485F|nr:hypothetical protein [Kitasatospora sp. GP82]
MSADHGDVMFAGSAQLMLAVLAGVTAMPVLLWTGMRALREQGNHLLLTVGSGLWFVIGGHVVETNVSTVGTEVFLVLFALVCGLLSLVRVPKR